MSAALINRSLTTVRTELEFLRDSEVVTNELYLALVNSLPQRYEKGMQAWGADKFQAGAAGGDEAHIGGTQGITEGLENTSISSATKSSEKDNEALTYCKALYDYKAEEPEDLGLRRDDKIVVIEHLSEDWWKGYKKGQSSEHAGVFPSNYVGVISQEEFKNGRDTSLISSSKEKEAYSVENRALPYPPPQYTPSQEQPLQQQPSYGGYAQYPPPPVNYSPQPMAPPQQVVQPPQQQQQIQVQQGGRTAHPHIRSVASKFGNAAIFGAGATAGSDLLNSIF